MHTESYLQKAAYIFKYFFLSHQRKWPRGTAACRLLNRSLSHRVRCCFSCLLETALEELPSSAGAPRKGHSQLCVSVCVVVLCVFSSCSTLRIKELFKNALCNSHWVIKPNCHFSLFDPSLHFHGCMEFDISELM